MSTVFPIKKPAQQTKLDLPLRHDFVHRLGNEFLKQFAEALEAALEGQQRQLIVVVALRAAAAVPALRVPVIP